MSEVIQTNNNILLRGACMGILKRINFRSPNDCCSSIDPNSLADLPNFTLSEKDKRPCTLVTRLIDSIIR